MTALYGKHCSAEYLGRRTGDLFQLGGILPMVLSDGVERGMRAAQVRSGGGLDFLVLLDRGMDIGLTSYKGIPLTYYSATGMLSPYLHESRGIEWLRGFHGGLLITCGMMHFGSPEVDHGKEFGQHGRISYLPARQVAMEADWDGDDYVMEIRGMVHEAAFFGENLVLRRRIVVRLGEARLRVLDTVENRGHEQVAHRILYHINPGFPLLDDGARLLIPSKTVEPYNQVSANGLAEHARFSGPIPAFEEQAFYHQLAADEDGYTRVATVNDHLGDRGGLGLYVRYPLEQLPEFLEWKMMGEGAYVVGMEPSNTPFVSRAQLHAEKKMVFLEPGESKRYELEIGVLPDGESIKELTSWVGSVVGSG